MASSDNLMTMEPWGFFRNCSFNDALFSDVFVKETEALTKVLQQSFSGHQPELMQTVEMISSPSVKVETNTVYTQSASGPTISGGSENETAVSKRLSTNLGVSGGGRKISKRKPRASKRTTTTYIAADAASFRQMVQQVTGVRIGGGNGNLPVAPVLKPEPRRPVDGVQTSSCLPTLDTSAFLLDTTSTFMPPPQAKTNADAKPSPAVEAEAGSGGFGFDSFCSFPTLESWEGM